MAMSRLALQLIIEIIGIILALAIIEAFLPPAHAAPPPNADMSLAPWFHSLVAPKTHELCCGIADCRNYKVRPNEDHYEVLFDGQWLPVPKEAVLEDVVDNPTGDYIACVQREYYFSGVLSPRVVCFIKRAGT